MTITLNKNSANTIAISLNNVSQSYFLFEFIGSQTDSNSYCIVQNTSTYTSRYYEFLITDTASPVSANGQVNLKDGQYTYNIYEQASSTNVNPASATLLKSDCICKVGLNAGTTTEYSVPTTNVVYSPSV